MSELPIISPERAAELVRNGAVLIDVRGVDEYAREHIPGARHHALTRIDHDTPVRPGDEVLVFHCRSGARTRAQASRLASAAQACEAYVLDGGIESWKKAGLPVRLDRRQPIDLICQVQIAAGSLVLICVVLGFLVTPLFYVLSGFVGAGLLFAGSTGYCGMTHVLALLPWNRRAASAAAK